MRLFLNLQHQMIDICSFKPFKNFSYMKAFKLLLLLLLAGAAPTLAEEEYATWEFSTGAVTELTKSDPIDVTKVSSSFKIVYRNITDELAPSGDLITGMTFKGYNPGNEQTRHVRVLLACSNLGKYAEPTCVFDGDCTIAHGGTVEECISLLDLHFDTPYAYQNSEGKLYVTIESSGEVAEDPLFFVSHSGQPVATVQVSAPVRYFSGTLTNQDGSPVANANVCIYRNSIDTGETLTEYVAKSDAQGNYSVRVDQSNFGFKLEVTAAGYATYQADWTFYLNAGTVPSMAPPKGDIVLYNKLSFTKGQQATIVWPDKPDKSWGRYYRLDRREGNQIIFERELNPQAALPYVIFPEEDFQLDLSSYELSQLPEAGFVPFPDNGDNGDMRPWGLHGSYQNHYYTGEWGVPTWCVSLLDKTPDCDKTGQNGLPQIGAFRAYLIAAYDSQMQYEETRMVFVGEATGITETEGSLAPASHIYDLQGRSLSEKPSHGLYILNGQKYIVK